MGFGLLQDSLGLSGSASPAEIKSRYRALAQRCRPDGEASPEEHARLRQASLALAQELAYLGHDGVAIESLLLDEGCPGALAGDIALASSGPVSRVVPAPLERVTVQPVDAAYTRLAERTLAAESIRTATVSSYGFGFIARLAIAFLVVIVALVAALDFFPRVLRPEKGAPQAAPPVPIQLVPAEKR